MNQVEGFSEKFELNNNYFIPRVGHGCNKIRTEDDVDTLAYSLNIGFRLLDTASFYGNEHLISLGIKKSNIERKDVFVTTKLWNSNHGYESCKREFEKSLKKMNLEYVDAYLVHWPSPFYSGEQSVASLRKETWKAMEEIYKSGKARSIGVCNYMVKHLKELLEYCEIRPAINQCELHIKLHQDELIDFCKKEKIIFQGYSPLAKGLLLSSSKIKKIANDNNLSPAQICLHWVLSRNSGGCFLIGASQKKHLDEVKDIFSIRLSEEEYQTLDSLNADYHCTVSSD